MAELSISEPTDKTKRSYAAAIGSQGLVGGTIRRWHHPALNVVSLRFTG
ncbi:hypothetical protein [Rhodopirellula europaea]|uniref:Uncharacterized protein n=1 Tax=Rhodopirellula europaea SH398 TaxID=1263868 RepID=M5S7I5_9BACT|nr:hypothetical protein [Rhodopirellula europaea]EMI23617.1 hypothetical protein RESH_05810 [Rhodopirellula europaea SH398]